MPDLSEIRFGALRAPVTVRKMAKCRAACKYEPSYWDLDLTTPRHGDRPFEIGHIDHTELDVELRCETTGHALGRPWVTLLVDAFSRRILAAYLTFDLTSYRSLHDGSAGLRAALRTAPAIRRCGRRPRV